MTKHFWNKFDGCHANRENIGNDFHYYDNEGELE